MQMACGYLPANNFSKVGSGAGVKRSRLGKSVYFLVPLPLWSLGIIGLARNCEKIYGAQLFAGKILLSKDLRPLSFRYLYRLRLDHDRLVENRMQGQMSQRGCGYPPGVVVGEFSQPGLLPSILTRIR